MDEWVYLKLAGAFAVGDGKDAEYWMLLLWVCLCFMTWIFGCMYLLIIRSTNSNRREKAQVVKLMERWRRKQKKKQIVGFYGVLYVRIRIQMHLESGCIIYTRYTCKVYIYIGGRKERRGGTKGQSVAKNLKSGRKSVVNLVRKFNNVWRNVADALSCVVCVVLCCVYV